MQLTQVDPVCVRRPALNTVHGRASRTVEAEFVSDQRFAVQTLTAVVRSARELHLVNYFAEDLELRVTDNLSSFFVEHLRVKCDVARRLAVVWPKLELNAELAFNLLFGDRHRKSGYFRHENFGPDTDVLLCVVQLLQINLGDRYFKASTLELTVLGLNQLNDKTGLIPYIV